MLWADQPISRRARREDAHLGTEGVRRTERRAEGHDVRAADCRVLSLRRMNSAGNKASGRRGRRGFGRRHPLRTAGFLLLWAHQLAEGERIFGNGKACRGYHLNLNTQDGCTNNGNYPPQWTSPDQIDRMFFDLAGDCCKFFFPNAACEVTNVCEDEV